MLLINNGVLFSIAEPFSKGKQTQIWQSQERSTFWPENIQHGCLDSTLYLEHWSISKQAFIGQIQSWLTQMIWKLLKNFGFDTMRCARASSLVAARILCLIQKQILSCLLINVQVGKVPSTCELAKERSCWSKEAVISHECLAWIIQKEDAEKQE